VSSPPRHEVLWTATALKMLANVSDRRIQQQLFDTSKRLEVEPEKQGKPLREDLMGFRSLRVVGQRYRLVYSVLLDARIVHVVAAGLRREGSRDDIYELARKMVHLGLAPAVKALPATAPRGRGRKRK